MMDHDVSVRPATCRVCLAYCPVSVTLEGGRVRKVEGNKKSPLYEGFICPKGRALAGVHNQDRLKHHLKRQADGSFVPISSEQLIEEVSDKLQTLIDRHGPNTVATYFGGPSIEHPALGSIATAFFQSIGSTSIYSALTIDQPGHPISQALHGMWGGGFSHIDDLDLILFIGTNPIISKQYVGANPGATIKRLKKQGAKLIVIDPRRNETARHSDLFLPVIPGEDPTILAGLIHLLFQTNAIDVGFIEKNVDGVDMLREAVASFTPDYVAKRSGVPEDDLRKAAEMLAQSTMASVWSGTGPSMATRGTLTAYLGLCIQSLRGFWPGEGAKANRHHVLMPSRTPCKAQPNPPSPAWGFGRKYRINGLQETAAGQPTGALPGEILTPGDGQVTAMFMHGGAALTWPDADLTKEAMESLELLIVCENLAELTPTSKLADYVIATKLLFETASITLNTESSYTLHPGLGWEEPYAAYQKAILQPPADADVLETWQIYYRIAQRLDLELCLPDHADPESAFAIDMVNEPSTDELYEIVCRESVVPLAEVKKHPDGKVFEEATMHVGPRDAECDARLVVADSTMMGELKEVIDEPVELRRGVDDTYRYLLIPRRMQHMQNAQRLPKAQLPKLQTSSAAYMNAAELETMNLEPGDKVKIASRHGEMIGFVDIDNNLRKGVLSMCHGYGVASGEDGDPAEIGANVNQLVSWDDDFDPYTGMPRMGALPVSIVGL